MSAETALEEHRERLLGVRGVVGVGLGLDHGEKVIVVMCERSAAEVRSALPHEIKGTKIVIRETGPIRAY